MFTQEKAISAFSQSESPFNDIRALVVDEVQNIERVANDDDQRAKTLYDFLIDFRLDNNPDKIIINVAFGNARIVLPVNITFEIKGDNKFGKTFLYDEKGYKNGEFEYQLSSSKNETSPVEIITSCVIGSISFDLAQKLR